MKKNNRHESEAKYFVVAVNVYSYIFIWCRLSIIKYWKCVIKTKPTWLICRLIEGHLDGER